MKISYDQNGIAEITVLNAKASGYQPLSANP
jgi:hypothetical protein